MKIIIITFCFISALFSDEKYFHLKQDNKIDFTLNDFQIDQSGDYHKIKVSDKIGSPGLIGMPKLPTYTSLIMVDPTKNYRIEYNVKESHILENINLIPNQRIENGLEKKSIEEINSVFYNSSNKYPYVNVSISEKMVMRDLVLVNLSIIPFNYFPDSKQLEVYEFIEINLIEESDDDDFRLTNKPRSQVFEKIYQNQVLNYNTQARDDEYQMPSILYICSGSVESNSSFQQLVSWRSERGYIVYTASTSNIGSNASSIKNYIENAYENFNPPPEYVALIGDVGGSFSIPTYYEDYGHDSYGNECEGDLPYSQLVGNDLFPEVIVGRMSIRSTSEIAAVVSKIINYEKATYLGNLDNYYQRGAMAGDPSSSGNSCAITKEYVKEILEAHGMNDVDIKTSGSSWSSWMQNELNDGVLYFNYRGYLGMSGFSTSDVDNTSNGYKLPFATILTCGTGSFAEDQTCMSEKFFRAGTSANPKGAVAAVGTATWNTHTLFNNIVDMGMYDGLFADKVGTAGAALTSGKLALYNTYSNDPYQWIDAFTQWNNLMGDPATHLWTKTPEVINVIHPLEIPQGTNFVDIYVEDSSGNSIENAMITTLIRGNPENYFTNQLGQVVLNVNNAISDDILITVTKDDCKPYQNYIDVNNEGLLINLNGSEELIINDGNNSTPEAGETFGLSIPLENFGNQNVSNIVATLSSSSSHVVINLASVNYNNINAGETQYSDDFNLTVLPTAIQGENLDLTLSISDGSSTSSSIINLNLVGSHLLPSNVISLNPGQSSNVNISLSNSGFMLAEDISAELISYNNLITVNDSYGTWGDIPSGQTVNSSNDFNITLSNDIIDGSQIALALQIQGSEGYDRIEYIIVSCGNLSSDDPMGPDQYGYYIYDSSDTDYGFAPSYDWIEIDTNYGGTGSDLNLSDNGNGNWSGSGPITNIDLPFTFRFYGIDYNEITVCTNGWIALGNSDMESFRNYPIPGPGGPSPMIAAFWDDLENGNSGDVFYKEFNDYVIIEWSDMRTQNNNSLETFQVILYDNAAQPYGDNEIKIQYKEFNNTSSGSFSSYPPVHGAYATIGIENHLGDDGLQYTFLNQYAQAAATLSDNSAILITTEPSVTLPAPELGYSYDNLNFEIEPNQIQESILYISNTGEAGSLLSYSVSQMYPDNESPFDITGGGPDSYGFYWTDSSIGNDVAYEWIDITNNFEQVSFSNNDNSTELINIGFDFSFYGETYSQFLINPNGWIGFEDDNDEWYNGDLPSAEYPRAAIFGFWDDLNPANDNCNASCSGNVYYQSTSNRLTVWFDNVYHWASEGYENSYYDFQIVLHANGEIDINHRTIEGAYSATVGLQNSTGTIASQVDEYSGDYFNNNVSYKFIRPYFPDWLSIYSNQGLNGELLNGNTAEINIVADATNIEFGEYSAAVIVSSNALNSFEIPVSLVVADLGIIGDINGDGFIDVIDVVSLVSMVLNVEEYLYNADFNQDGLIDVLDVVSMVNYILNG